MHTFYSLAMSLMLATSTGVAGNRTVTIQTHDRSDYRGELKVSAGSNRCVLLFKGADDWVSCKFELPPGVTSVTLDGDLRFTHYRRGKRHIKGTQIVRIVDIAPVMAPLRDRTLPMSKRIRAFDAARAQFEKAESDSFGSSAGFAIIAQPAKPELLRAAEKRLGYPLPKEHAELLTSVGRFEIGDSWLNEPERANNAYTQMRVDWGTDESHLQELSPKIIEFLKSTTILFTEAGDGYGALLYRANDKACKGDAYYWIHQDEMSPERIKRADGSCGDYTDAIVHLINQFVLIHYDDHGPELMLFDSGNPDGFLTQLFPDSDDEFSWKFRLPWG